MSMSNTTENDVLKMRLQGIDPAWRAGPSMWLALYTADPGEAGTAVTNEATYGGYARVLISKATGWTDSGAVFANSALVQFPQCTTGSNALTFFAVVTTPSGAGQIIDSGNLTATLNVAPGIQPQFATGSMTIAQD